MQVANRSGAARPRLQVRHDTATRQTARPRRPSATSVAGDSRCSRPRSPKNARQQSRRRRNRGELHRTASIITSAASPGASPSPTLLPILPPRAPRLTIHQAAPNWISNHTPLGIRDHLRQPTACCRIDRAHLNSLMCVACLVRSPRRRAALRSSPASAEMYLPRRKPRRNRNRRSRD